VPTYEYECERCRRVFEVWQRITEPPLARCETCGGPLRRLLSPAPFILKGEGWYVTDYPSEARKKAMEAEKSAAKSAETGAKTTASAEKSSTGTDRSSSTPARGSSS